MCGEVVLETGCRFSPEEEEDARRFLRSPSLYPRFSMLPNYAIRRVFPVMVVVLAAMGFILSLGLTEEADIVWVVIGGFIVMTIAIGVAVACRQGLLVLDPAQAVLRYRKKDYPFAHLGLPRLSTAKQLESYGEFLELVAEVQYDVLVLGEVTLAKGFRAGVVIFNGDSVPKKKLSEIANLLNDMLREFHEREAVRRWLRRRDAEAEVHSAEHGRLSPEGPDGGQ